ncbi:Alpha/Beta hydrolase protein [Infundibulicybe gibba]|nr:Alpha/Beta hydrolase protein [Infundibulicybe gibba]
MLISSSTLTRLVSVVSAVLIISAYKPFTYFASAAYCAPHDSVLELWCELRCECGIRARGIGGDGASTQFCEVRRILSAQNSVIVAHQGTDTSQIDALATDANVFQESLDPTLFPGISSSVEVHSGFANEQAKTATQILAAVRTAMATHSATHVTIVGHSLGAAIALLDGVYLPLHIPSATFTTIGYAMPRVGNQAFANYVDAHLSLTHINNREDIVPIVPGLFLGYHHPSGEVHIQDSGVWVSCPGQDNTNSDCIVGDVPSIFDGHEGDHSGPYDGVKMGC